MRKTFLSVFGLLMMCSPANVFAQGIPVCADHQTIVSRLADGYGESRQSIALGADNTVVETFASLETGTWTIVVTTPGGPSCLVAAGQAFQLTPAVSIPDEEI